MLLGTFLRVVISHPTAMLHGPPITSCLHLYVSDLWLNFLECCLAKKKQHRNSTICPKTLHKSRGEGYYPYFTGYSHNNL